MEKIQPSLSKGYHISYISGVLNVEELTIKLVAAIELAKENGKDKMIIDISKYHHSKAPSITEIYYIIHKMSVACDRKMKIAMILNNQMMEDREFGNNVAANNGLLADAFTNIDDASEWFKNEV